MYQLIIIDTYRSVIIFELTERNLILKLCKQH